MRILGDVKYLHLIFSWCEWFKFKRSLKSAIAVFKEKQKACVSLYERFGGQVYQDEYRRYCLLEERTKEFLKVIARYRSNTSKATVEECQMVCEIVRLLSFEGFKYLTSEMAEFHMILVMKTVSESGFDFRRNKHIRPLYSELNKRANKVTR